MLRVANRYKRHEPSCGWLNHDATAACYRLQTSGKTLTEALVDELRARKSKTVTASTPAAIPKPKHHLPRAQMNTSRGQDPKAATSIAERVCAMRGHQQWHMSTFARRRRLTVMDAALSAAALQAPAYTLLPRCNQGTSTREASCRHEQL